MRAELLKYFLKEKQDYYGAVALIEREVELAMTNQQFQEVTKALPT